DNLIPAAAGGMAGEAWDTWSFSKTALADTGDWMLTGRTTAAGEMNEVLVRNGQIILREGDALEGTVQGTHLSGTLTGFAGAVAVNEDGDWAAIWDMDLPDLFNRTVILVNGEIVFSTDAL